MLKRSVASRFRAAVILSGSGVYDGSELTEAVCALIHLERVGAKTITCFAPDALQHHVVDHSTGAPTPNDQRNIAVEAARINRGAVSPMKECIPEHFDALVLPGGFGVMKNLSSYAVEGKDGSIRPDIAWSLEAFHAHGRPIAAACIAPMLLARVLPKVRPHDIPQGTALPPLRITMGATTGDAAAMATAFGATMVAAGARECVACESRKIVTTPAYMVGEASRLDVFQGIGNMMDALAVLVAHK